MSAPTDANGTQKYWYDGLPIETVIKSGNDPGTMKFWYDGLPSSTIFALSLSADSVSVSDNISTSESVNVALADTFSISDNIILSESLSHYSDQIDTNERIVLTIVDNLNVNDSTTLSENVVSRLESNRSVSELITTTESYTLLVTSSDTIAENITASESLKLLIESLVNKSDSAALSESLSLQEITNINVSDTGTISESYTAQINTPSGADLDVSKSENISISESRLQAITPLFIGKSDSITLSESLAIALPETNSIAESINVTESSSLNLPINITATDNANLTEQISFVSPDQQSVAENVNVSESLSRYSDEVGVFERVVIAVEQEYLINKSETITVTESPGKVIESLITASESLLLSEAVDVTRNNARDVIVVDNRLQDENGDFILDENGDFITSEDPGDIVITTESIQFNIYADKAVNISNTITLTENVGAHIDLSLAVSENLPISEALFNGGVPNPNISESITVNEALLGQIQISNELATFDSVSVSESISIINGALSPVQVNDTVTASETVNISVPVAITTSNTITTTDNTHQTLVSPINVSDSTVVTDQPSANKESYIVTTQSVTVAESLAFANESVVPINVSNNVTVSESRGVAVVYPDLTISQNDSINLSENLTIKRKKHHIPKVHDAPLNQDPKNVILGQNDNNKVYLGYR